MRNSYPSKVPFESSYHADSLTEVTQIGTAKGRKQKQSCKVILGKKSRYTTQVLYPKYILSYPCTFCVQKIFFSLSNKYLVIWLKFENDIDHGDRNCRKNLTDRCAYRNHILSLSILALSRDVFS